MGIETHVHESDSIADRSRYNVELHNQVSDIVKTKRAVPCRGGYGWSVGSWFLLWFIPAAENGKYRVYLPEKIMPILTVL